MCVCSVCCGHSYLYNTNAFTSGKHSIRVCAIRISIIWAILCVRGSVRSSRELCVFLVLSSVCVVRFTSSVLLVSCYLRCGYSIMRINLTDPFCRVNTHVHRNWIDVKIFCCYLVFIAFNIKIVFNCFGRNRKSRQSNLFRLLDHVFPAIRKLNSQANEIIIKSVIFLSVFLNSKKNVRVIDNICFSLYQPNFHSCASEIDTNVDIARLIKSHFAA